MFDLCQVIIRAVTRPFFYPTFAKVMLDLSQASSRVVARPFFYPSFPKFRMDLLINFLGCFITRLHNLFVHCSEWKGPGIHNFLNKLFTFFLIFAESTDRPWSQSLCPASSISGLISSLDTNRKVSSWSNKKKTEMRLTYWIGLYGSSRYFWIDLIVGYKQKG